MAKNNGKALDLAYGQVNGLSKNEVAKPEHQANIEAALESVWSYAGHYEGENDALRDRRLDLDSPQEGQVSELAQHFKELYPSEFGGKASWNIIFTMFNRMKVLGGETAEVISESVESTGNSDTNNNIPNEKEKQEMAANKFETQEGKQNLQDLEELQKQISSNNMGKDIEQTGSKPVGATKASIEAAQKRLAEDTASRIHVSETTTVEKVVVPGPKPAERAVNATEGIKGKISKPETALTKFNEKFGTKVDPDTHAVSFTNAAPGAQEDALVIYNALVAAKEDADKLYDAYISNGSETIKGVKTVNEKGDAVYKFMKDIVTFIATSAMGVLPTADPAVQLQLHKARKTQSKKTTGAGLDKPKAGEGLSGIATVRFTDKKKVLESMAIKHKELDKSDVDWRPGFKSAICAKYIRHRAAEDGGDVTVTYRIPLEVEQYATVVVDEALKDVFGDGSRTVGAPAPVIDIADKTQLEKMLADIVSVVTDAAAAGVEGELFDMIRNDADKVQSAEASAQAAAFAEI